MTFTKSAFGLRRPMLWHLTHRDNLPLIRKAGRLQAAARLAPASVGKIRRGRKATSGQPILRDQDLLSFGSVDLTDDWTEEDLLRDLAARVFFWAGWENRPVRAGRRAAERYVETDLFIRVPFASLAEDAEPFFSRWNSGATRMQHGERVPRGPTTFQTAESCEFDPADVKEVTFIGDIALPEEAEIWHPLEGKVGRL